MRIFTTKNFAVIISILVLGAITSCTNNLDYDCGISDVELSEQSQSPYHIPVSEAIGKLESMMSGMGMENTRALQRGQWTLQRVPLSAFKPQTRSGDETEESDAIYVVNFGNDEGYAILSADRRLPDDVIAVTTAGSYGFIEGPVTDYENTDDTLLLEDLYVPEDDDYLLGANADDRIINDLVTGYVMGWTDSLRGDFDDGGSGKFEPTPIPRLTYTYSYETITVVPEMLTTTWDQRSPYNDQCPRRYYYKGFLGITCSAIKPYDFDAEAKWKEDFIRSEDLAAGCVAIATAQIMAYNQYPTLSDVLGEDVVEDWDWLLADYSANPDSEENAEAIARQKELLAKLVHKVGVGCNMNYGFYKTQSFTTPAAAARYLDDVGYSNAHVLWYNFDKMKSMLDKHLPVFVGAVRRSDDVNGHAWVIDGYQYLLRTTTARNMAGQVVSVTTTILNSYVHCNWGWEGSSDGWFSSQLLKDNYISTDNAVSFDDETAPQQKHYDFWFRMIEYDK